MSTATATVTFTRNQVEEAVTAGFEMAADESGVSVNNSDFRRTRVLFRGLLVQLDMASGPNAPGEPTYTREQVQAALNTATDAGPKAADNIDNFAVNATLTLLDDPDAAFGDVAEECYGEDADEVAGWLADAR
ncbi:hypothetical protein ACFV2V_25145 [Streptomyces sp. NPDC059698]|uniref:hypothetical protein n=1 Tax=Streptomyces TaxID=1883 RepID=UPI00093F65EA|nr:hypothetical protein [Streptomyces sp. CB02366]OKJ25238.1 hypothetical protein AMK24_31720 [Streptomyces sp. CB02366]